LRYSTGYNGIQYRIYWDTVQDILGYSTGYIGIQYRIKLVKYRIYRDAVQDIMGTMKYRIY
jgi:hypothetical protein